MQELDYWGSLESQALVHIDSGNLVEADKAVAVLQGKFGAKSSRVNILRAMVLVRAIPPQRRIAARLHCGWSIEEVHASRPLTYGRTLPTLRLPAIIARQTRAPVLTLSHVVVHTGGKGKLLRCAGGV